MKIKEYKVVHADSTDQLSNLINDMVDDGWTPQGGVFCSMKAYKNYFQAMILYWDVEQC